MLAHFLVYLQVTSKAPERASLAVFVANVVYYIIVIILLIRKPRTTGALAVARPTRTPASDNVNKPLTFRRLDTILCLLFPTA